MTDQAQPKQTQTAIEQLLSAPVVYISLLQERVMNMYSLGLNVFPMPHGRKSGYSWRMMQYTRLNPEDIFTLFDGQANVAVMTGRTSGNLFVIDCETRTQFKIQEKLLRDANIPLWATKSGSNRGGGHFYLKCKDGEVKNVRPGERTDYEVRGNRCYVLAPPSRHPDGGFYEFYARETITPPEVSLDQIAWLALELTKDSQKHIPTKPFMELSEQTRQFIYTGAPEGERNNRLFASACDMAGNGYKQYTALQLLEAVAINSGLPQKEVWDTINSAYSQPRTPAKPKSDKTKPPALHEKATAFAKDYQWKGRTGQTNRAVFMACCERAINCNENGVFRASAREVADLARVTAKTASNALGRLVNDKLLVYCGQDHLSRANLYRFGHGVLKKKISRYYHTICLPCGKDSVVTTGKNDALERGALGKSAFTLYSSMIENNTFKSVKELSEHSKLSKKQVYRGLRKLKEFGLVEKNKTRYMAIPLSDEELDEQVAIPAGTYGKGQRRIEQHRKQRASKAAEKFYKARWSAGWRPSGVRYQQVARVSVWVCGNCGQQWSLAGLDPPLVCDYCNDVTTWKMK